MIEVIYKTEKGISVKWPQMFTTGKSVTVEQAQEIIRRTDRFFADFSELAGGNNRAFNQAFFADSGKKRIADLYDGKNYSKLYETQDKFEKEWGCITTSYVSNSWASCAFVGGPHGWCHPDGTISYKDNIGKWPSLDEVVEDWKLILETFPFLEINVTLYEGESCESEAKPSVSLTIGSGKILVHEDHDIHGEPRSENNNVNNFMARMMDDSRELGLSPEWIDEFARKSAQICDKLVPNVVD